jgi:hypothetical protein
MFWKLYIFNVTNIVPTENKSYYKIYISSPIQKGRYNKYLIAPVMCYGRMEHYKPYIILINKIPKTKRLIDIAVPVTLPIYARDVWIRSTCPFSFNLFDFLKDVCKQIRPIVFQ